MKRRASAGAVRRLLLAALLAALPLAARGDRIADAHTALQSWAGTVEMTTDAWTRHAVPTHFARRTLAAARHALAVAAAQLAQDAAASSDAARVAARLAALDAAIDRMQALLAQGDRDAMVGAVRALQDLQRSVR
jgi:hypothetical protein